MQRICNNEWLDKMSIEKDLLTIKEAETTKHVHRLHPYKGKFIP